MSRDLDVFLFRRDHRLVDNLALLRSDLRRFYPVFVFNTAQTQAGAGPGRNRFFSPRAFALMLRSLAELDAALGGRFVAKWS